MTGCTVREEASHNFAPIHKGHASRVRRSPHGAGAEPGMVVGLRQDGDLALSLIAVGDGGALVGHTAWSPALLSTGDGGWLALGPISVLAEK